MHSKIRDHPEAETADETLAMAAMVGMAAMVAMVGWLEAHGNRWLRLKIIPKTDGFPTKHDQKSVGHWYHNFEPNLDFWRIWRF